MTDQFPDATKKVLSPAAEAVLGAIESHIDRCAALAAALRVAALYTKRDKLILLSIVDELEQFNG